MNWLHQLFSRRRRYEELSESIREHLEEKIADLMDRGMTREKAERTARREFGNVTRIEERSREVWQWPRLESIAADMRFARRQLLKSPGFTTTAVLTLALGIGANTAIFTLVHGILLRSLPVADPARLYRIGDTDICCVNGPFLTGDFSIFSYDLYLRFKNAAPEFEQLAAVQAGRTDLNVRRGNAAAKSLVGEYVTGNYFVTLGLGSYAGRLLLDSDDKTNSPPAAVISYRTWQNDFAADPSIIGSTIFVQARPVTVVGIAPPGFFGDRVTDFPPDVWLPVHSEPYISTEGASILHDDSANWLYPLGRLRSGTNLGALQAKLSVTLRQRISTLAGYTGGGGSALIPQQHVVLSPGGGGIQNLQQRTGQGLKMLMILSSVVLLIACANIANLLLARATARRAEVAVRMAMGAGRRRLIRQILTESVLLSCIGGVAGLAVAYAGSHTILALAFPDAKNLPVATSPSLPVLGFAFLVSLLTGILFGVAPAWFASHSQPADALRGANRSTRDRSSVPQKAMVVLQAALSLVLLAGAILMSKSLANLEHQNLGLTTANRYVLHFDPLGAGYTIDRVPALNREIQDRFQALPGVAGVGLARYSPLEGENWGDCVMVQGQPPPPAGSDCIATWDRVSTGFLDSIGVPIVQGRGLSERDTSTSPRVAVINQTFAKKFFPNQDPIGKYFGSNLPWVSNAFEIVGVFADFKMDKPREEMRPVFLRPLPQKFTYRIPGLDAGETNSMFPHVMILRFHGPQQDVDALIRRTMAGIDPNLTVVDLRPLDTQVAGNFNQERLIAKLTSLFGILALILASVGLYGVMAYFVARRTSEIGIRIALGAKPTSVVGMVLRDALWQILFGLVLGIPAALVAGHLMASQLYGVTGYDPLALVGATFVLGLCAAAAGFIPARRAAAIEPMQALRSE
jgi:macrolide transport system ATP-binding/permease protein